MFTFSKSTVVYNRGCFTTVQADILLLDSGPQIFYPLLVASRNFQDTKYPSLWEGH